jgi:hypothetical protein
VAQFATNVPRSAVPTVLRDTPTFTRTWVVRIDPVGRLPTADGDSVVDLRRTIDNRHPVTKRASAPVGRAPAEALAGSA